MTRLVLATANPHKIREIAPLFPPAGYTLGAVTECVPGWDVEETGATLAANAELKARAAAAAAGAPAVADDTGLFVDALDGAPGVRSARFAGAGASYADNIARLLAALTDVPADRRTARFRTVVALARPAGDVVLFEGVVEGTILERPRGVAGFGYDPVFLVRAAGRTLAEMTLEEKNAISHRALAFRAAGAFLLAQPDWAAYRGSREGPGRATPTPAKEAR